LWGYPYTGENRCQQGPGQVAIPPNQPKNWTERTRLNPWQIYNPACTTPAWGYGGPGQTATPQGLPTGWLAKIQQPGLRRLHRSDHTVYLKAGRGGGATPACATPEPRRAGQTIEAWRKTGAGKIAWRKRIGHRMEQPSHARRRSKKPAPATGPIPRKAKRGNHAEPNRTTMAQSFRRTCRPTSPCPFFARAQRPS